MDCSGRERGRRRRMDEREGARVGERLKEGVDCECARRGEKRKE